MSDKSTKDNDKEQYKKMKENANSPNTGSVQRSEQPDSEKEEEQKKKEEEEEKEKEKQKEIREEEEKQAQKASGLYGINFLQLEDLMGGYKERGNDYQDLKLIKELGGVQSILDKLKTDKVNGVKSIEKREEDFGSNKVFVEPVPPFCAYVWEALEDMMVRILIVAAIVQIVLGATLSDDPSKDWVDGLSIVIAVLVVTIVGSVTNWKKETKFHELNDIQSKGTTYKIVRNGVPKEVVSDDLLVGDLIYIMVGDIIAADLLLVESNGIKMDESALTGESDTMKKEVFEKCEEDAQNKKKPASPLILSGTNCVEGTGKAIVIAVGDHSQKGIIRRTVDNAQENNQTPLEEKLDVIAGNIGWFGMGAGAVTLVALFIRFGVSYVKDRQEYRKSKQVLAFTESFVQNNPEKREDLQGTLNQKLTNPKKNISNQVLDIILLCVSIIVVAIPEGLPLAVTLSLAFSIKKLMDQNNLVRKMHACETMGGANYICTDKTGTLTKNEMNVFKVLVVSDVKTLKETIEDEHAGSLKQKADNTVEKKIREDPSVYFKNENFWNVMKTSVALNLDGTIKKLETPDVNGDTEEMETKNKTDKAFIDFLYRFRSPVSVERNTYIEDDKSIHQVPFDSKRKRMTTYIKNSKFPKGYRLFTKGGAENVKLFCKYYLDPETGSVNEMRDEHKNFISDKIEEFNKQMLRSLYVCYKDISQQEFDSIDEPDKNGLLHDQKDLVFVSVVGIRDSLRNGVKEAVLKCQKASVKVIMVTGDNIVTATAIAKDCNILGPEVDLENMTPEDIEEDPDFTNDESKKEGHLKKILENKPKAITGNTFFAIIGGLICKTCKKESSICKCPKTEAEAEEQAKKRKEKPKPIKSDTINDKEKFLEITKNLSVMARSQPIHKYALVLGLKEQGSVVAVTGDGTNDAPALSKSNVGFAMFAGTDIAKEASDIIIIDNNFSSIVVAIIYGRNIYDNIRKFLQFQLTVNFCACLLVFVCACVANETPLTPIQMLWVNLIMDSLGSLALATEPPYEELLLREPTRRDESIINGKMWKHIAIQSLVQLAVLLFLYLYAPHFIKEDDVVRLAENQIIKYCFGQLPGNLDEDHIIFGTKPQWKASVKFDHKKTEMECGEYASRQDLSTAFKGYSNANGNTAHMTIVFDVFVIYTLFNQINSRVLDDSFNIFVRIFDNLFFPLITFIELVLQIIIIEFGNEAFKVTERGLTAKQWGIVIGFSAITFVLSIIIKLIPLDVCIQNILDNSSRSNKVANSEDLESDKKSSLSGGDSRHKSEADEMLQINQQQKKKAESSEGVEVIQVKQQPETKKGNKEDSKKIQKGSSKSRSYSRKPSEAMKTSKKNVNP